MSQMLKTICLIIFFRCRDSVSILYLDLMKKKIESNSTPQRNFRNYVLLSKPFINHSICSMAFLKKLEEYLKLIRLPIFFSARESSRLRIRWFRKLLRQVSNEITKNFLAIFPKWPSLVVMSEKILSWQPLQIISGLQ